ncbi:MAG: hypothetical protein BWK80_55480 [Desulfobacteraceae bacterium IS3]|nr:MAG: hypothetical protein BWK80_55480 [Desulfobacteraceae bacterium IS3]
MTADSLRNIHDSIKFKAAEKYRQQGFEVIVEPSVEDMPFDLGTYHTDLLVKKSESEGYIIEIKDSAARTSIERYREISEIVSQHSGWRFLLITGEDALLNEGNIKAEELLSWEQIFRGIKQGERLISLGEIEGAVLSLWSILEAMMRKQAEKVSLPIERFPTSSLINHLYSQGELSIEQFDQAKSLLDIRNYLVHGFQAAELGNAVKQLRELVTELFELWSPKPPYKKTD